MHSGYFPTRVKCQWYVIDEILLLFVKSEIRYLRDVIIDLAQMKTIISWLSPVFVCIVNACVAQF